MPSFISSSRVVLISAASLLVAYALGVEFLRPVVTLYPDQNAYNLARAERALIGEGMLSTILVGSSLGVRLPDDWLPGDWMNLSLGGKGAATGLALVEKAGLRPARILVEINTLDQPLDQALLIEAPTPIPLALRKWIRGLRLEYRPINLLLSSFGRLRGSAHNAVASRSLESACDALPAPSVADVVSPDIVARETQRQLTAPVSGDLGQRLAELKAAISRLKARGIEIVLIEWPVAPAIAAAPRQTAVRDAVKDAFPDFKLISFPLAPLRTEDGLHLAPVSARRVACDLVLKQA